MKTLIEQLDEAIYKRIIEKWEEDHWGDDYDPSVDREYQRACKNIIKHLVDIGVGE